jgi:hypothetical protein
LTGSFDVIERGFVGLFQQFIPQSGAATAIWGIDYDNVYAATEIGKILGCPSDIEGLTTCFLEAPTLDILYAHNEFQVMACYPDIFGTK